MTISKNKKNYWKGRKRGPQTKEHIHKIMQTRQKNNSYICSKEQVKKSHSSNFRIRNTKMANLKKFSVTPSFENLI